MPSLYSIVSIWYLFQTMSTSLLQHDQTKTNIISPPNKFSFCTNNLSIWYKYPCRCSYFILKILSSGSILWTDLFIPSHDIPITHSKFPLVLQRGCVHATSLQSCPTLKKPMDHSWQVPLSMGFPRQEYLSGLPCPLPVDLPNQEIEPASPCIGWWILYH